MAAIPAGCRVYNTDLLGRYLILTRPDVRVSLDGRNDLYDRGIDAADIATLQGRGDLAAALGGTDCVLVPPTSGLARRLAGAPGWAVRAADRAAVLYLRRPADGH